MYIYIYIYIYIYLKVQTVHHNPCFNLFMLHSNPFDNQGSEINKNEIFYNMILYVYNIYIYIYYIILFLYHHLCFYIELKVF